MSAGSTPNRTEAAGEAARVPHIRIVPHIVDVRKDLYFEVMDRDVPEGTQLKVGRFTEKVSQQMSRIAFKSKVVSRSHAEVWTDAGQFFIRDTKSSSGTFLNHMRLSPPGVESRAHPLHDGDILQLGVDYQGGHQDIYKCVKIRLEINRTWQRNTENPFRRQVMANIQNQYHAIGGTQQQQQQQQGAGGAGEDAGNNECCICLYQMVAFQALFLAPCSHCFHYKCVKPILFTSTSFNCPLCRTYADLEASVTIDENEMDVDAQAPVLPAGVAPPRLQQQSSSQQQQQQPAAAEAAAAEAEAAVRAAEAGSDGARDSAGAAALDAEDAAAAAGVGAGERDDMNATPVPSEQANVDSFGTTPVGSAPTSLGPLGAAGAVAEMGDADASLVAPGAGDAMQMVSSPARPAADDSDGCSQPVAAAAATTTAAAAAEPAQQQSGRPEA
ncbi:hypothetical protein GGF46_003312 [Coemansia sp. RSA 552]|nr:hypothetical protein GGF46_003312 [Coemansia sp. RSA 552]